MQKQKGPGGKGDIHATIKMTVSSGEIYFLNITFNKIKDLLT